MRYRMALVAAVAGVALFAGPVTAGSECNGAGGRFQGGRGRAARRAPAPAGGAGCRSLAGAVVRGTRPRARGDSRSKGSQVRRCPT